MPAIQIPKRGLYINGAFVEPIEKGKINVENPANKQVVGTIPSGTHEDIDLAVQAAHERFHDKQWKFTGGADRAKYMRKIAQKIKENTQRLSTLESIDNGRSREELEGDLGDAATCFEYYADLAEALDKKQFRKVDVGSNDFLSEIVKQPLGIAGLITPWNYPLLMAIWKVAPAMAAGCCMVLKPSEYASVTCLELAQIFDEVGVPGGVLNVVTGYGKTAGAALANHKKVNKISFTGSVGTGSIIASEAGRNLKPTTMELGGKSCMVIMDDADISKAVEWVMFGIFAVNGQICSATSRLLVHQKIYQKFLQQLVQRAQSIKQSDPLEEGCRMGPIINKIQFDRVMSYVEAGKKEGAKLLTGGKTPSHLQQGYFLEPTIFSDVKDDMKIWREEIFGPVLSVRSFSTIDEAIQITNDTDYGLAAAIVSSDAKVCRQFALQAYVGITWINCSQPAFCQVPWGGVKYSGYGRDLGENGMEPYMNTKQITTYTSDETWSWYPKSKL